MEQKKKGGAHLAPGKRAKTPPLFVYLMYLLVATVLFTGVTFSGYVTTTLGNDQARVAKFEIVENSVQEKMITAELVPGETTTETLKIQNKSEVAVEYTITVKNVTNNLPIEFTVDNVGANAESGEFTYTATLQPNDTESTYVLQIHWPTDDAARDPEYVGMVDLIKVSVSAIQKD